MSEYVRRLREKVGHDLLFWPSAAVLVRDQGGKILLVRHVEGHWMFPAGAVDPGETPAEAARREAREEASIQLELVRVAGVFGGDPHFRMTYAKGDEVAWVTTLFEANIVDGVPAPGDDEISDVRWVTIAEAFELGIAPSTRHMLERVQEGVMFDP